MEKFSIIGAGALGQHISAVLQKNRFTETDDIHDSDWIFVTVPDDVLQSVIDGIPDSVSGKIITCSASVFVQSTAHKIESAHPLQTFPKEPIDSSRFDEIFWAVEPNSSEKLLDLIQKIGGKHFSISAKNRIFYHAMAIVASNLMIGLLDYAKAIGEKTGLPEKQINKILQPLVQSTINNYFENGFSALSGPAKRGDIQLIEKHLNELEKSGINPEIYKSVTDRILKKTNGDNERSS